MSQTEACACNAAPKLIFACSGAADVGALSDLAARRLSKSGPAKMFCLAGVAGRVPGILRSTEAAGGILAIDGCPLDCAKRTLKEAGFTNFHHLQLADMGYLKGESAISDAAVGAIADAGGRLLKEDDAQGGADSPSLSSM